jgi:hypothetical protein
MRSAKEFNFKFKNYSINLARYLSGVTCASVRSNNDYFTQKYVDYTRAEIVDKVKQEINQRSTKQ